MAGLSTPPHLQILRIDREGMIDDVIAWHMTSFVQKKHEKDVVGIITFDLIGLLPTNHITAYITMAYRSFLRKQSFDINSKTAQTTQNI